MTPAPFGSHRCPAPGCRRLVPRSHLACSAHWRALPKRLRDELTTEWRRPGVSSRQRHLYREAEAIWSAPGQLELALC